MILSQNAPSRAAETRVAFRTGEAFNLSGSPDNRMRSTFSATPKDIKHDWFVVDASGMILGRLAAEVARIIRGKHKPIYTPHMDTGPNRNCGCCTRRSNR